MDAHESSNHMPSQFCSQCFPTLIGILDIAVIVPKYIISDVRVVTFVFIVTLLLFFILVSGVFDPVGVEDKATFTNIIGRRMQHGSPTILASPHLARRLQPATADITNNGWTHHQPLHNAWWWRDGC